MVASIYLDYNATTPMDSRVLDTMLPFMREHFGNPSSAHQQGRRARRALEDARELLAHCLDAAPDEVVFTSGATESNNLALTGLCGSPPARLVASPIEHPCVTEPLKRLAAHGFQVDWLPVDADGLVQADVLRAHCQPDTRLISVMLANHETGVVQPIAELVAETPGVLFHCDAAQAVGKVPVSFRQLGVTSLSLSGHKVHGPMGIGALLVRRGCRLQPSLAGGHQQGGRRPGTEPVPLAVGLATAVRLACEEREHRLAQVRRLRLRFLACLQESAAPVILNGPAEGGIPHTVNLSFPGVRADALLMSLDLAGVACSTGSACSSGSLLPSPVLLAMRVSEERLHSAMRFSLSHLVTPEQIEEAATRISASVHRLRTLAE